MEKSLKEYILSRNILEFKAGRSDRKNFSDISRDELYYRKFVSFLESVGLEGTKHDFSKGERLDAELDYFTTKFGGDLERKFMYGESKMSLYVVFSGDAYKGKIPVMFIDFEDCGKNQLLVFWLFIYYEDGTMADVPDDPKDRSYNGFIELVKKTF